MDYTNRTYHEVLRGSRMGLSDGRQYPAGYALRFSETNYYVLKLWIQQEKSYYISKNNENSDYYTIYGKKETNTGSNMRLVNPVGYARMTPNKEYLEIILPDFPNQYYMCLFAKS